MEAYLLKIGDLKQHETERKRNVNITQGANLLKGLRAVTDSTRFGP